MNTAKTKDRVRRDGCIAGCLRENALEDQLKIVSKRDRGISLIAAKDNLFLAQLESVASNVFKNKVQPSSYATKKHNKDCQRIFNITLSDLHLRSLLDSREVPLAYGPKEESRRLAAIAVQVADYKIQHRENTTLYVHLLGDVIQNQLHDPRDGAPIAEQSCAAIYLLSQLVGFWSSVFPNVIVFCTEGNHGRNTARHHDRAVYQKWDSIERIIYYSLKMAVQSLPNVEVVLPYSPYYTFSLFDKRGFGTHGDTVFRAGNPGKNIDVENIEKQANRLNAAEAHRGNKEFDLFVVGHTHVGAEINLPNGSVVVLNGCLIPPGPFEVSLGITESQCGQQLFESVKGFAVGDRRFIEVDKDTDKDRALDKVIKPFEGF